MLALGSQQRGPLFLRPRRVRERERNLSFFLTCNGVLRTQKIMINYSIHRPLRCLFFEVCFTDFDQQGVKNTAYIIILLMVVGGVCVNARETDRDKETDRQRQRERERETETDTDTQRETDRFFYIFFYLRRHYSKSR